ncbi:hypothetical protein [Citrobacter freundii]
MNADLISFETLQAAKETAAYTFWIMIGTWVAGVGTSAAVAVSLYVTITQRWCRLLFNLSEMVIISPLSVVGDPPERGLSFVITNLSSFPVSINNIGLKTVWRPWKETKYWYLDIVPHPFSQGLPTRLDPGEECKLWITLEGKNKDWFEYFSKIIAEAGKKPNHMKIVVSTSFGKSPSFKMPKWLIEKLNGIQASQL